MIVFGIHCNFFIVLIIRLKTCRPNGLFFFTRQMCGPGKSGLSQRFYKPERGPSPNWRSICPGLLNIFSFQKKMLSNLTCVLTYSMTKCVLEDGFKGNCVLKILWNLQKCIHVIFRVATSLNEALRQMQFLKNLRNIQNN